MIEHFTDFSNLILASGTVPDDWSLSIICPIYKKGPPSDPNNYRGISLINCIGKLFASIITARLQGYLEANGSIGAEQAGFRSGFGCEDHTFLLSKIVSIYLNQKTRRERPKSAPYLRLKNIQGTTIGKIWKKNFFSKKN